MVKLSSVPTKNDFVNFQTNIDRLVALLKKEKITRAAHDLIRFCRYLPGGSAYIDALQDLPAETKAERIRFWMVTNTELQELRSLNLSGLGLRRLPDEICLLKNLISLSLNTNLLTELPESIGQLKKLRYLMLINNNLTSLPESIGELSDLRILLLSRNKLTRLPDGIGQLKRLTNLFVDRNRLKSFPAP